MMRRFRQFPTIGGRRGGGIPADCVEVEYLESTGTQYIDTGYTPNINNIQKWGLYQTDNTVPFGCTNFTIVSGYHRFFSTSGISFGQAAGNYHDWVLSNTESSGTYLTIDGVSKPTNRGNVPASGSLWLFARSDTGAKGKARLYYFTEVTSTGDKSLDLVPVRRVESGVSVGYMCDRLTGQLYGNQGTGAFVVGPDRGLPYDTELEWAKGDGACGFLLPFKAEMGYSYTVDFSVDGSAYLFGSRINGTNADAFSLYIQQVNSSLRRVRLLIFSADEKYSGYGIALNTRYSSTINMEDMSALWFNGESTAIASTAISAHTYLGLFGDANGGGTGFYSFSKPTIYGFKRSQHGEVVNDYVFVLKDGDVYLYDKVTNEMIEKTGSGSFEHNLSA